jgi:ribosomal 50S subunit-recycling heat shock protein
MNKVWLNIVAVFFVLTFLAFAAEKPASNIKTNAVKTNIVKAAKMHATGKVIEIYYESIKIERTVKGDIETMEFALAKPSTGIIINDSVKIDYTEKDGKLIASRVSKVTFKSKEVKPAEAKSVSGKK